MWLQGGCGHSIKVAAKYTCTGNKDSVCVSKKSLDKGWHLNTGELYTGSTVLYTLTCVSTSNTI